MTYSVKVILLGSVVGTLATCTARQPSSTTVEPEPRIAEPTSPAIKPSVTRWAFQADSQQYTYQLSSISTVRMNNTPREDTLGVLMTFRLALQTNSPVQRISGEITDISLRGVQNANSLHSRLPVSFTGTYDGISINVRRADVPASSFTCSDTLASYLNILYSQINTIPSVLERGMSWQDSLTGSSCQGSIPITVRIIRHYRAVGETSTGTEPGLLVNRTDSSRTMGEGADGQHRITINTLGVAEVSLLLDPRTARVLRTDRHQTTQVLTKISGQDLQFTQTSKEAVQRRR